VFALLRSSNKEDFTFKKASFCIKQTKFVVQDKFVFYIFGAIVCLTCRHFETLPIKIKFAPLNSSNMCDFTFKKQIFAFQKICCAGCPDILLFSGIP
jgi:hypothetical protein